MGCQGCKQKDEEILKADTLILRLATELDKVNPDMVQAIIQELENKIDSEVDAGLILCKQAEQMSNQESKKACQCPEPNVINCMVCWNDWCRMKGYPERQVPID